MFCGRVERLRSSLKILEMIYALSFFIPWLAVVNTCKIQSLKHMTNQSKYCCTDNGRMFIVINQAWNECPEHPSESWRVQMLA